MFVCIFDEEKTCSGLMFAQAAYSSSFMQPARKDGGTVHYTLWSKTLLKMTIYRQQLSPLLYF